MLGLLIVSVTSFAAGYSWRRLMEAKQYWKPFRHGRSQMEWIRLMFSK